MLCLSTVCTSVYRTISGFFGTRSSNTRRNRSQEPLLWSTPVGREYDHNHDHEDDNADGVLMYENPLVDTTKPTTSPACQDLIVLNDNDGDCADVSHTRRDIIVRDDKDIENIDLHDCLYIKIHNCPKLKRIPSINMFHSLESLHLSCIDMSIFHFELPPSIASLRVTYCGLREFRPANVVRLVELDLSFNKLQQIPACLDAFHEANAAMRLSLKNNDFWFDMYSSISDSLICRSTVDELIRANKYNLVGTPKLLQAIHCLQLKKLDFEANRLSDAVNLRLMNQRMNGGANGDTENEGVTTYADKQNVHLSSVQSSFKQSVMVVVDYKPKKPIKADDDDIIKALRIRVRKKNLLKLRKTLELPQSIHVENHTYVTFRMVLKGVYCMIQDEEDEGTRNCMMDVLGEEIEAGIDTCFTGKITRIVNALSGFRKDVNVGISRNEEISNSIIAIRKKYALMYTNPNEYVTECIPVVLQMLEDLCVPEGEQVVWIEYV